MLVDAVDFYRLDANRRLDPERRVELGQFMTPPATARLMASMFGAKAEALSLLDAGAGVGSLTAAFVDEICRRDEKPKRIHATAYEIDPNLIPYVHDTLGHCRSTCLEHGISFDFDLLEQDFIDEGTRQLRQEMFSPVKRFNCVILNPPYKKMGSDSEMRLALRELGVETSNLYTAFVSVALKLLDTSGEIVAITPRSFCNGSYFKPFRKLLLKTLTLRRIHVFESREDAFSEDQVLQENVIIHGSKIESNNDVVTLSASMNPEDDYSVVREIPHALLVRADDPDCFFHIVPDELAASIAEQFNRLHSTLAEHDIEVSTGRVVDFRATSLLRVHPGPGTVPLIYPLNLNNGFVQWPDPDSKKPQALAMLSGAEELLLPQGTYVVVKRFTAKEESRRIVAAVYDPNLVDTPHVAFENHLNYFHRHGTGLPPVFAKGLAAFLSSTLVDLYFRQFSGHTQVNATDLRNLKYPTRSQIEALGLRIAEHFPNQDILDRHVEEVLNLPEATSVSDPVKAKKRIDEALGILKMLGLPREQQNERSALTLLALIDLKPATPWTQSAEPLVGITPMMQFFSDNYGKKYAPNTRETVRRQTIHQFLDAGMVNINPDDPRRPTNSPYSVYQVERGLLKLLRSYGTPRWEGNLRTYLASTQTLQKKYARERQLKRIPIQVTKGRRITLSPGGQNVLVRQIIQGFCQSFTSGGKLVYVGDTDKKWAYFDQKLLGSLGVTLDEHGKVPDVIVYVPRKKWLVLIEAVTSHGPVNPKRRGELKALFSGSKAGLVFVTAFLDRRAMMKHLDDISWETEVWVADAPEHLIHFNGERFLGPYEG